jgi:dephospho-CoA kinase
MSIEEKRRHADDQIDCSGTLEYTRSQTERLAARWKNLAAA